VNWVIIFCVGVVAKFVVILFTRLILISSCPVWHRQGDKCIELRLTSSHANGEMRTKKTAVDHDGFLKLMLAALRLFLVLGF